MRETQKKKKWELLGIGKAVLAILLGALCGVAGTPKVFQNSTIQEESPVLEYVESSHFKDRFILVYSMQSLFPSESYQP